MSSNLPLTHFNAPFNTLLDGLRYRAEKNPDSIGYVYLRDGEQEEGHLTFAGLHHKARALAARLQQAGAQGERVLLLYPPGLDFIVGLFGCIYAGCISVPAYSPRMNRNQLRLQAIADDAIAKFVLSTASLTGKIQEQAEFGGLKCLSSDDLDLEEGSSWRDPQISAEDIATLQYTSGSTGNPKGVILTHKNLLANARLQAESLGGSPEDRIVSWTPVFHDMGFLVGVVQPVCVGAPVFSMAPASFVQRPRRWLEAISKYKATVSGGPNFAFDLCINKITEEEKSKLDLSSWRLAFNGAEPVRPDTLRRFVDAFAPCGFRPEALHPCYGLAEATLMVTVKRPGERYVTREVSKNGLREDQARIALPDERSQVLVSSGSVLAGVEVLVCNPETLTPCPAGVVGEICVKGESNAIGYWQKPELTAQTFNIQPRNHEAGFLRTGDLGVSIDGELFVTGRRKDLIIIRGTNHYPQDLETVASNSHPSLVAGCCAAFSIDISGEERVVIVQEVERSQRNADLSEVLASIRKEIVDQCEIQPYAVILISPGSISRTSSGKIQRYACREEFRNDRLHVLQQWTQPQADPLQSAATSAPSARPLDASRAEIGSDQLRNWLVAKLAELTGHSPAVIDTVRPFAEFGLDSKDAVGLSGELESYLGRSLPTTLLYDYPSIDSLTAHFTEPSNSEDMPSVARDSRAQEDIAVVGMACRFPGAQDLSSFWDLLRSGTDAISEVPPDRWKISDFYHPDASVPGKMNSRWGGFLKGIDGFDAKFFGISRREAEAMDPQQRLLLEITWQSLEDAGLTRDQLRGSKVGSFIGISTNEYTSLVSQNAVVAGPYMATGNALSIAANRLSYFFDWRGPSLAVDTACSSSLVAVHLACQSLLRGECKTAVAGGVNLILSPALAVNFTKAGLMAPDGRCKSFDASADGFVRSEGAAVLVLKPLSSAIADSDRIYCVIRGGSLNQDGRSNGLMAPNRESQVQVLREAYEHASVDPQSVQMIEAHGSGTLLGDAMELGALDDVFGPLQSGKPRYVGSVKSNIGHAEAAAGIAGFIKAALSIYWKQIPSSLHHHKLNPEVSGSSRSFLVPSAFTNWPAVSVRRAGVSSFGFGGANVHLVLEQAPPAPPINDQSADATHLLALSAHTSGALDRLIRAHVSLLESDSPHVPDLCHTLASRRTHQAHRIAFTGRTSIDIRDACAHFLSREANTSASDKLNSSLRYAFVFPGHGSQWAGMGMSLIGQYNTFREVLVRCDAEIRQYQDWSLIDILSKGELTDDTEIHIVQPALFSIQVALAALWGSWGIRPHAVIGQSLGEITAAHIAGVLSLEDAIRLTCVRGNLLRKLHDRGGMLMTALSRAEAEQLLSERNASGQISIGVCSSPSSTVLSGDVASLDQLAAHLAHRNIYSRKVKIDYAAHSSKVDPLREELLSGLKYLSIASPSIPLYSTVTGRLAEGIHWDAAYWWRSLREPVLFADAIPRMLDSGVNVFVEISPHPVATHTISECVRSSPQRTVVTASLNRGKEDGAAMLESVAALYTHGADLQWDRIVPPSRVISTPPYPFERERYWIDDIQLSEPIDVLSQPVAVVANAESKPANSNDQQRKAEVTTQLRKTLAGLLRMEEGEIDLYSPFLEMGADSIVLISALESLNRQFGVNFTIRQLFEELTTLDALADRIVSVTSLLVTSLPSETPPPVQPETPIGDYKPSASLVQSEGMDKVFREQLSLANRVLDVIAGQLNLMGRPSLDRNEPAPSQSPATEVSTFQSTSPAPPSNTVPTAWTAYNPIQPETADRLSEQQRQHLSALIERYNRRTERSKLRTQQHRSVLADNRASAGFRYSIKEMLYPIQAERSHGSQLWDIDGNQYVDVTMGFGVNLFGHGAPFLQAAIQEQLSRGIQLGPQSDLAGEVAQAISELTGMERVTFCNSGTEAVMMAIRLARTATQRKKLVLFSGSYHGTHDGVLGRSAHTSDSADSLPLAPGILQSAVSDVIVLPYAEQRSLDVIRQHGHEIAAVLVEPVQSRRPDIQPKSFLRELRSITEKHGSALIFDEIITGFRLAPGGAQEWFEVRADIATYGKVLGGGMPIGVVAGAARYMDGIDGGHWSYGDRSYPQSTTTVFAGTFCKHPLTMAAAKAVLRHLRETGPELQHHLNRRTSELAEELNTFFESGSYPIRIVHCGSLFRFSFSGNMDLLFFHLMEKGIYIWEGRNCFLSTAHTEQDVRHIVKAVQEAVQELARDGFLLGVHPQPPRPSASQEVTAGPVTTGPLLEAQQDLWRLCTRDAEASIAYHVQVVLRLQGKLDVDALRSALRDVVFRHPILLSKIDSEGSTWQAEEQGTFDVPCVVLDTAQSSQELTGTREITNELQTSFDLSHGPMVRAKLLHVAPDTHILLLTAHHIAVDGVSLALLLQQTSEAYNSRVRRLVPSPERPSFSFPDYVRREQEQRTTSSYQAAEKYWTSRFEGFTSVADLPTDLPRPRLKTYRSHQAVANLPMSVWTRLKETGTAQGASSFMTLFAAFAAYLHRICRQSDLVIGIPISDRGFAGGDTLVGYCTNVLAMRSMASSETNFASFLSETKSSLLDAFEHRKYPFSQLISSLKIPRDVSRSPLLDIIFNLDKPSEIQPWTGVSASLLPVTTGFSAYDLSLNITEAESGLTMDLQGNSKLFLPHSVRGILGGYLAVLTDIADNRDSDLSALHVMGASQRRLVLQDWNSTHWYLPAEQNVCLEFERRVEESPGSTAVIFQEESLTYRELNQKANYLATILREHGIRPDIRVAFYLDRSLEMVIAILGILKAGGAFVPLDVDSPIERIQFMLEDAAAAVILTQSKFAAQLPPTSATTLLLDQESLFSVSRPSQNAPHPISPQNLAYVIYTSGSTGRPKGAMNTHEGLYNRLMWMQREYQLQSKDRVLQKTPCGFDVSVWEFLWPLITGATLVMARPGGHRDPQYLQQVILEHGITTLHFVPPMLAAFLSARGSERCDGLRLIFCSGEGLPAELTMECLTKLPAALHNLYGPTEAAIDVTYWHCEKGRIEHTVPIGRPIANLQTYVLDDWMEPCPIGVPGELFLGGLGLGRGYLNASALTAEKFVPHPFSAQPGGRLYRTGDLVRWSAQGDLIFIDRLDFQVKIRGFRIELGEIEKALLEHPEVQRAIVLAREDNAGDRRLAAYVVARETASTSAPDLAEYLRKKLPQYMVPASYVFLSDLPLSTNGKLDRSALPTPQWMARSETYRAPASTTERQLATIWSEVLSLPRVGVQDNFFEVGGDSILALRIVSRALEQNLLLNVQDIFEQQTIEHLATRVRSTSLRQALPERGSGAVALTPIQRRFFEQNFVYPSHWNQSLLLRIPNDLKPSVLQVALNAILDRHDAFRLRFVTSRHDGSVSQRYEASESFVLEQLDLASHPNDLEAEATRIQQSMDIVHGPVFRAAYIHLVGDAGSRLLLAAHHLVIDAVSWRILAMELQRLCASHGSLVAARLPNVTHSFGQWSNALASYASSARLARQQKYWLSAIQSAGSRLPTDEVLGANTQRSERVIAASLGADDTSALRDAISHAYHLQVQEAVVTAIALTLAKWTKASDISLDMEWHGRDASISSLPLDFSHTVGWFTALFPVRISLPSLGHGEALRTVKEILRTVPDHGIGYGVQRYLTTESALAHSANQREVLVNYLGQLDYSDETSGWAIASESRGQERAADNARSHLIEIDCYLYAGQMQLRLAYSESIHREATVRALLNDCVGHLREISSHCSATEGGPTPSDYPSASISQGDLDHLWKQAPFQDLYSLSPMQQGILFHSLRSGENGTYVNQLISSIQGNLNVEIFRHAWALVIERHPVLRTRFVWDGVDTPLQIVDAHGKVSCVFNDWSEESQAEQEARLDRYLDLDRRTGFDLQTSCAMRIGIFQTAPQTYKVVWTHHHIILDGWSAGITWSEVFLCYQDLLNGDAPSLAPAPSFAEYIRWIDAKDYTEAEDYWRRLLEGFRRPVALAVISSLQGDAERPQSSGSHRVSLSRDTTKALGEVARRTGVSLNTLVETSWAVLLSRYSDQLDIVFGATVAGRPESIPGIERTVGLFINTVPRRFLVQLQETGTEAMRRMQGLLAAAWQHQECPLTRIQALTSLERHEQLFETIFVFENYPLDDRLNVDLGPLKVSQSVSLESTNYKLTAVVQPGSVISLQLLFTHGETESTTVKIMLEHWSELLSRLASSPDLSVQELLQVPAVEQQLLKWGKGETTSNLAITVLELWSERVLESPNRIAVRQGETALTYSQIDIMASAVAHDLARRGVKAETLVGICLQRTPDLITAMIAVLKAGAAYVPLDPGYPAEQLQFTVNDVEIAVILTHSTLAPLLPPLAPPVVLIDSSFNPLHLEPTVSCCLATGDNLFYAIYTSGSTGRPKCAGATHRAFLNLLHWYTHELALTADDKTLIISSFTFDATQKGIWGVLLAGGTVHLGLQRYDPELIARTIQDEKITILTCTPSAFYPLAEVDLQGAGTFQSLRRLVLNGEPISADRMRAWSSHSATWTTVTNAYGPTECTDISLSHTFPRQSSTPSWNLIGRPLPNVSARVLLSDLTLAPPGVTGELFLAGMSVGRGYANRPGLTADRFVPDPYAETTGSRMYRTGDRAAWTAEGFLQYAGRADDQVKVRGFRIEPEEIETALRIHPNVDEAAVVTVKDRSGDHRLVAYVILRDPVDESLPAFLRGKLPPHMIPSEFIKLSELPISPNGKLDRKSLIHAHRVDPDRLFVPALTNVEKIISRIFMDLLNRPEISIEESFFEMGGHSLLAIRLISQLRREFGIELPLDVVFEYETVRSLASAVENTMAQYGSLDEVATSISAAQPFRELSESDVEAMSEEELNSFIAEMSEDATAAGKLLETS